MIDLKQRILIGSPICQKASILTLFLESLQQLTMHSATVDFLFIDDNIDEESQQLLKQFKELHNSQTTIVHSNNDSDNYFRDHSTHYWNDQLIWKVANFKNRIIKHALEAEYDALFLIDSDLLLHPNTIEKLMESDKDIISEIFWTSWQPNTLPMPQVWVSDEYTMFKRIGNEILTNEEEDIRSLDFLTKLRIPGVHEVGGLGACTLIRKTALQRGVNFSKIDNLSFWGEDRHFCIRAQAIGLFLHVDTHYPAFHIYRESDLTEAKAWIMKHKEEVDKQPTFPTSMTQSAFLFPTTTIARPKLTLSMVVHNEADKHLRDVLAKHREYIDEAVIIDDGSTDNSADICREMLKGIPLHMIHNETKSFSNEVILRQQQWAETLRLRPEWILNMDADEMFEDGFANGIASVLQQANGDVGCFRLYDMWSDSHYREDSYWNSHSVYRPFLLRYRDNFSYRWKEQPLHCGRFPDNILELPSFIHPYRVKHMGWSTPAIRTFKYERYLQLDPDGRYGLMGQYESILDANPRLLPWSED